MRPTIKKQNIKTLLETKFIKVFDLQYAEGRHYYNATRRSADDLVAVKSTEEFQNMLPDAVSCITIWNPSNGEPKLLLNREFRYPAGQFLLSVPAGLIDPEDCEAARTTGDTNAALLATAAREIKEETGLVLTPKDTLTVVNPFLFSTPGMTDESNALVCAIVDRDNTDFLSQTGAVGSELFDGFVLVTPEKARELLAKGRDDNGHFYSVFTWAALMYFLTIADE